MSKLQTEHYPYISNYLHSIIGNKTYHKNDLIGGVTANTILDITNDMQEWLSENVRHDGKNNYAWSESKFTINQFDNYEWIKFSESIAFKYEEDLLAFRLRWGINE
jgi:hypothetical protein